jgi:hypothetical protein
MLLNSSTRFRKDCCHSFMNAVSKKGRALPGNILLLYGDEKLEVVIRETMYNCVVRCRIERIALACLLANSKVANRFLNEFTRSLYLVYLPFHQIAKNNFLNFIEGIINLFFCCVSTKRKACIWSILIRFDTA